MAIEKSNRALVSMSEARCERMLKFRAAIGIGDENTRTSTAMVLHSHQLCYAWNGV